MTAFEMAQEYYPKLWSIDRLRALVAATKLTPEEYTKLTGEAYSKTSQQA